MALLIQCVTWYRALFTRLSDQKTSRLSSSFFNHQAEQTRIVEKLEELLSDLDAGVAELKAAQKKLGQYRQSLLKAAVEGALTAEWRAARKVGAGDTAPETGAQLLERILTERRARWEAKQLAKFAEQGKSPPKDWQKKYPEPVQPDTSDLPELPEGWVWATLSQVGWLASGKVEASPTKCTAPLWRAISIRADWRHSAFTIHSSQVLTPLTARLDSTKAASGRLERCASRLQRI